MFNSSPRPKKRKISQMRVFNPIRSPWCGQYNSLKNILTLKTWKKRPQKLQSTQFFKVLPKTTWSAQSVENPYSFFNVPYTWYKPGSNTILLSWQKASRRTKTTFISAKKEKVNFPLNMGSSYVAISGCLGWVSREVANPWWRLPASAATAALRGSRCWKTSRLVMAAINGLMVVEFLSSISFQTFSLGNSGVS